MLNNNYVADLHAIISRWSFGAPILVGHWMGGHNVMVYAGLYSDTIRAMVAVDSPATYPEFAVNFLRAMAERVIAAFPDALLEDAHDLPAMAELLAPQADRISYDSSG